MPTSKHFCRRQYWQRLRVTLLIWQFLSRWQVYTMFFWILRRKKPWKWHKKGLHLISCQEICPSKPQDSRVSNVSPSASSFLWSYPRTTQQILKWLSQNFKLIFMVMDKVSLMFPNFSLSATIRHKVEMNLNTGDPFSFDLLTTIIRSKCQFDQIFCFKIPSKLIPLLSFPAILYVFFSMIRNQYCSSPLGGDQMFWLDLWGALMLSIFSVSYRKVMRYIN